MRVWEAAVEVLRETENNAVMWGDSSLLHMISERAGRGHNGWRTEARILNALDRTPGPFIKRHTRVGRNRLVRVFRLPEAP